MAKSDIVGILGSGLCLVHCLMLPVIFIGMGGSGSMHGLMGHDLDYLFLFVAWIAVYFTTKKTDSRLVKFLLWGFLLICSIGIIFHDYAPFVQYIIYLGSTGLIVSHLINIRRGSHT